MLEASAKATGVEAQLSSDKLRCMIGRGGDGEGP